MKRFHLGTDIKLAAGFGLAILLLPATFGGVSAQDRSLTASHMTEEPTEDPEAAPAFIETKTPETLIQKWPKAARVTARAMIEKYGEPNHYTAKALVWVDNGPWKKTVVYAPGFLGKEKNDFIEQTIAYRVPAEKIADLKRFDQRLAANEQAEELSVRSARESTNFLMLNLADEIVSGARTPVGARDFYVKTVEFTRAGMSSPYVDRLLFTGWNGERTEEFR